MKKRRQFLAPHQGFAIKTYWPSCSWKRFILRTELILFCAIINSLPTSISCTFLLLLFTDQHVASVVVKFFIISGDPLRKVAPKIRLIQHRVHHRRRQSGDHLRKQQTQCQETPTTKVFCGDLNIQTACNSTTTTKHGVFRFCWNALHTIVSTRWHLSFSLPHSLSVRICVSVALPLSLEGPK